MTLKRKWATAGLALALAVQVVGCAKDEPQQDAAQDPAKSGNTGEKVKLIYARGQDVTGATTKLVDAFMKSHPNISVEFREMPSDTGKSHDQYVTMFSAKSTEIDVFDLDVIWPAEFAQAGYLLPLDRFVQQDNVKMGDYIKGAVQAGTFNGQQWTMPKFIDTGLLFYRSDIVKTPPKTWDELATQARALKGQGGTQFGYLMQAKQYEGLVCNFIEFAGAYGGRVLDEKGQVTVNTPETVKGLKKMIEIAKSDFVPNNVTTFTEPESATAFIQGQSVFLRNWPYQFALANDKAQSKIVGNVALAPLPAGDKGSAATLGGWLAGINKNSKHPKEAWEFLKFMTGAEGQTISATAGGNAPTLLSLYDNADVQKASPLFANKDFVNGISAAVPRPTSPNYPKISDIIQIEVSRAIAGEQSAEDAVKNMETKIKDVQK